MDDHGWNRIAAQPQDHPQKRNINSIFYSRNPILSPPDRPSTPAQSLSSRADTRTIATADSRNRLGPTSKFGIKALGSQWERRRTDARWPALHIALHLARSPMTFGPRPSRPSGQSGNFPDAHAQNWNFYSKNTASRCRVRWPHRRPVRATVSRSRVWRPAETKLKGETCLPAPRNRGAGKMIFIALQHLLWSTGTILALRRETSHVHGASGQSNFPPDRCPSCSHSERTPKAADLRKLPFR